VAGERALNDHFERTRTLAKAEVLDFGMYRARFAIPNPAPLVSLIIPTRNGLNLIKQCIESILAKTTYKNYEILVVDNNSDDPATLAYFATLKKNNKIQVVRDERPFNYSALNNAAADLALGEYIGLINNDIDVISPEWLDEMMGLAIQPGVGAVGARLWYPNDTLQHGGCITGVGGVAGHAHKHLPRGHFGYFARGQLIQTLSVVTAACLVVKKSIYQEVGGLDEINFKIAFNDVDFCLRVREAGYRNVWTPYAELYHHESATRGYEDTPEKQMRFRDEVLYMQKCWGSLLMNDPAYSPNLTLDHEDFSYAWPPRVKL
jgi:GT2 family glycosyltransferase